MIALRRLAWTTIRRAPQVTAGILRRSPRCSFEGVQVGRGDRPRLVCHSRHLHRLLGFQIPTSVN